MSLAVRREGIEVMAVTNGRADAAAIGLDLFR